MNWRGCGRKRSYVNLRYSPGICLEVLKPVSQESRCPDGDSIRVLLEYSALSQPVRVNTALYVIFIAGASVMEQSTKKRKLIFAELIKKFAASCGSRSVDIVFTTARPWSLSYARWIQFTITSALFWYVSPSSLGRSIQTFRKYSLHLQDCRVSRLSGLLFDREVRSSTFLRNMANLLPDYMA
jgi:hypothetical protein